MKKPKLKWEFDEVKEYWDVAVFRGRSEDGKTSFTRDVSLKAIIGLWTMELNEGKERLTMEGDYGDLHGLEMLYDYMEKEAKKEQSK